MALPLLEPPGNLFKQLCWLPDQLLLATSYVADLKWQRHLSSAVNLLFVPAVCVALHVLAYFPVLASFNTSPLPSPSADDNNWDGELNMYLSSDVTVRGIFSQHA